MHNYVYKKTAFISKEVKAQTVGEQLETIQQENGKVTAHLVLDHARPISSPLHPIFQWDDEQAAEQYRLHQARNLIRSIEVVKPEGTNEPVYVHVKAVEAYLPIRTVVKNADLYESTKDSAEKRLAEAALSLSQLKAIAKETKKEPVEKALQLVSKAQEHLESNV
tara:strand:+ start:61 stop:555 length:495 start_codon:yes stop_codon:yes gene_type:complete